MKCSISSENEDITEPALECQTTETVYRIKDKPLSVVGSSTGLQRKERKKKIIINKKGLE